MEFPYLGTNLSEETQAKVWHLITFIVWLEERWINKDT